MSLLSTFSLDMSVHTNAEGQRVCLMRRNSPAIAMMLNAVDDKPDTVYVNLSIGNAFSGFVFHHSPDLHQIVCQNPEMLGENLTIEDIGTMVTMRMAMLEEGTPLGEIGTAIANLVRQRLGIVTA